MEQIDWVRLTWTGRFFGLVRGPSDITEHYATGSLYSNHTDKATLVQDPSWQSDLVWFMTSLARDLVGRRSDRRTDKATFVQDPTWQSPAYMPKREKFIDLSNGIATSS